MLIMQSEAIDNIKAHMTALCDEIKLELRELKEEIQLLKKEMPKERKANARKKM